MIRRVFVEDQPKVRTYHTPFSVEDIQSAVQEGRQAERERIIALLEKHIDAECGFGVTHDLIALIKKDSK